LEHGNADEMQMYPPRIDLGRHFVYRGSDMLTFPPPSRDF
jgi:hypothetical protein